MKTSEIKFKVTVDENQLPVKITWEAEGSNEKPGETKSIMLAFWDEKENNTLRVDLWTKDMMIDEMKKFYHQNIITLTDTYVRATGDTKTADDVKQFFTGIGKQIGVLQ
ncbi:MAG: gliding motility protein GldC [Bacteroidetes bacterium]|nr:gliding motility protein GldC [Bacteroidota bacterium]